MIDERLKNLEGRSRRNFLRWATAAERARRLIAIADPRFREELERGLRDGR